MNESKAAVKLSSADYERDALYIIIDDATTIELTRAAIEDNAKKYWQDPTKISSEAKAAAEFQRCSFCPLNKTGGLCDAIRPVFSFIEALDRYVSFQPVTIVYKDGNDVLYTRTTMMQEALRYLSVLSMVYYCQVGRTYWKYFLGIMPYMTASEIAERLYLNFLFLNNGNKKASDDTITKFKKDITFVTRNQVRRMNLVCKNDAFMNAFVNAQIITELMSEGFAEKLEKDFASRRPADLPAPLMLI